jgi:molybdopterin-guanine dinucleotide biosynthesis protein A
MNALILAGGESRRMGRNKALVTRPDGTLQIDHVVALARGFCDGVFLSLKDGTSLTTDAPVIPDLHPGDGPIAALEAAAVACGGPLLVIGCDLFLLDAATLAFLMEHRSRDHNATCFRNRIDGRAEPLCAVYETSALALAAAALAQGQRCARKFLESLGPQILDPPQAAALDNANTPAELAECFAKLTDGVVSKTVGLLYFAVLREARGVDGETVETLACTVAGLYEEIRFRHRLPLNAGMLRVAVNGEFADWDARISDGDEIVFIPPVAGG